MQSPITARCNSNRNLMYANRSLSVCGLPNPAVGYNFPVCLPETGVVNSPSVGDLVTVDAVIPAKSVVVSKAMPLEYVVLSCLFVEDIVGLGVLQMHLEALHQRVAILPRLPSPVAP